MKKILLLLLMLPLFAQAQFSSEKAYMGFLKPKNLDGPSKRDRWFFDFYHCRYDTAPDSIKFKPWSLGWNVSRMIDIPFNQKSTIGMAIGFTFSSQHFFHNAYYTQISDTNGTITETQLIPFETHPDPDFRRTKFTATFLEIPIPLRFRAAKKWSFFFYPGFKVGYGVSHHTKTIYDDQKVKDYRIFGFNKLHYGPTLYMGYNRLAVFGYYSLTSLWQENKGPQFHVINLGISLNFF